MMENKPEHMRIIFWILWALLMVTLPFYLFTFLFSIGAVEAENIRSIIPPVIGGLVIIAQIFVFVKSLKQAKQKLPLSTPFLTLLVGTILVALVWAGGCVIMGSCSFY